MFMLGSFLPSLGLFWHNQAYPVGRSRRRYSITAQAVGQQVLASQPRQGRLSASTLQFCSDSWHTAMVEELQNGGKDHRAQEMYVLQGNRQAAAERVEV
jgi:hypothetical protein